uniref:V-type proton ATPase subunit G n=1 Tax=Clastoptera arizonana TaxID=38151 RepID=A0A1B6C9R3_9HEMI
MSSNWEIKKLLEADRLAGERINRAKQRRVEREKLIKQEAQKEIDSFKTTKEEEIMEMERKLKLEKDRVISELEQEISIKLEALNRIVEENKEAVIKKMLGQIFDIGPEMHQSFDHLKKLKLK